MPLCIVVLVDIAETTYHEWKGSELSARTSDALRVACWTLSVINAVFVYESLQYVTALIGINSMLISVLLPIIFYVILHKDQFGLLMKVWYALVMCVVVAFTALMCYIDWQEFLKTLRQLEGGGAAAAPAAGGAHS